MMIEMKRDMIFSIYPNLFDFISEIVIPDKTRMETNISLAECHASARSALLPEIYAIIPALNVSNRLQHIEIRQVRVFRFIIFKIPNY